MTALCRKYKSCRCLTIFLSSGSSVLFLISSSRCGIRHNKALNLSMAISTALVQLISSTSGALRDNSLIKEETENTCASKNKLLNLIQLTGVGVRHRSAKIKWSNPIQRKRNGCCPLRQFYHQRYQSLLLNGQ